MFRKRLPGRSTAAADLSPAVSTCLALPHPSMSGVFKRWSPDGCDWLGDTNRAVRRRRVGDPAARRQINRQTARQEQDSTAWVTVHARAGRRPRPPIYLSASRTHVTLVTRRSSLALPRASKRSLPTFLDGGASSKIDTPIRARENCLID